MKNQDQKNQQGRYSDKTQGNKGSNTDWDTKNKPSERNSSSSQTTREDDEENSENESEDAQDESDERSGKGL